MSSSTRQAEGSKRAAKRAAAAEKRAAAERAAAEARKAVVDDRDAVPAEVFQEPPPARRSFVPEAPTPAPAEPEREAEASEARDLQAAPERAPEAPPTTTAAPTLVVPARTTAEASAAEDEAAVSARASQRAWAAARVDDVHDDLEAGFGNLLSSPPPRIAIDDDFAPPVSRASADLVAARNLFAELAANHVRNVRDFMIDLGTGQATAEWIPVCEPAVGSVRSMAIELELPSLAAALDDYAVALREADERAPFVIEGELRENLERTYAALVTEMPQAFALGEAKSVREGVIVRSLLAQAPGVHKVTTDKVYAAGIASLEQLFVARPDEVAATTGMPMELARRIVDRFRRYRSEMQAAAKDEARSFEKDQVYNLTEALKRAQAAYEDAVRDDSASKKRDARKARDAAFLDVKLVLARLGEVERVKRLEKLTYAAKIDDLEALVEALDKSSL